MSCSKRWEEHRRRAACPLPASRPLLAERLSSQWGGGLDGLDSARVERRSGRTERPDTLFSSMGSNSKCQARQATSISDAHDDIKDSPWLYLCCRAAGKQRTHHFTTTTH